MGYSPDTETEFLRQFNYNYIEGEYSDIGLEDVISGWGRCCKQGFSLTLPNILSIHYQLMKTINPRIAGKWRVRDVMIDGRSCPFISESLLKEDLYNWWKDHSGANTEEGIKQAHIAFEKIHPFEDGNGRVGRLIMLWQTVEAGLPIKIIYAGKDQIEYYKWFT